MTAGLGIDRLIDLLIDCFWWFVPFFVISHYERGVVLRFGKFAREAGPGFHWLLPLGIEEAIREHVKPDGWNMIPMTITLPDGVTVTISCVMIWEITDPKTLMLEVEDRETIASAVAGYIQDWFSKWTWPELQAFRKKAAESGRRHGVREKLVNHVNNELTDWTGVTVNDVLIHNLAKHSLKEGTIRTFQ
jgi:regulator of protease activity HflC (stomatin/prohibitin superfamily)